MRRRDFRHANGSLWLKVEAVWLYPSLQFSGHVLLQLDQPPRADVRRAWEMWFCVVESRAVGMDRSVCSDLAHPKPKREEGGGRREEGGGHLQREVLTPTAARPLTG